MQPWEIWILKKAIWEEPGPTLAGSLTVPAFQSPQLSHISHHQQEWLFSITAIWSSNTLRRNLKHQTPSINRETPNLLQWVNPSPHWNTALVPDKNGQGIGSPGQWPAEHPAGGDYINTSRRSLWGAGASHCLRGHCTQPGPCLYPLRTWIQECKMNNIFLSGITHLVWLVTDKQHDKIIASLDEVS